MPGAPDPGRRGPAPRTHSRIASGCPSQSTSFCRTCSRPPYAPVRCSWTCATSAQARGEGKGDTARSAPDVLLHGHCTRLRPRCDEPGDQPQGRRHRRCLRSARIQEENKKIMETVARHIVTIAEHGGATNVVTLDADESYFCLKNLSGQLRRATVASRCQLRGSLISGPSPARRQGWLHQCLGTVI